MKIKFLYPMKNENGSLRLDKLTVKINQKFIHELSNNGIDWVIVNCLNIKSLVIIGSVGGGKKYWCNTIPFDIIYKRHPILKSDSQKFDRKGFHKKIIEAIIKELKIDVTLESYTLEKFNKYIEKEYGR